jgi:hypothetical protein
VPAAGRAALPIARPIPAASAGVESAEPLPFVPPRVSSQSRYAPSRKRANSLPWPGIALGLVGIVATVALVAYALSGTSAPTTVAGAGQGERKSEPAKKSKTSLGKERDKSSDGLKIVAPNIGKPDKEPHDQSSNSAKGPPGKDDAPAPDAILPPHLSPEHPAPSPDQPGAPPGQSGQVSPERMQLLFDECAKLDWKPLELTQYDRVGELMLLMAVGKRAPGLPTNTPPQVVQAMGDLADQLVVKLRAVAWSAEQTAALNRFAADRCDKRGQGLLFCGNVASQLNNGLLLKIDGTDKTVVVPDSADLAKAAPGSRWMVLGFVGGAAQIQSQGGPQQQVPLVLSYQAVAIK